MQSLQIRANAELELRKRRAAHGDPHAVFQAIYRDDPAAFARDCLKWDAGDGLTDYQAEILTRLVRGQRMAVRSPHGAVPLDTLIPSTTIRTTVCSAQSFRAYGTRR